ncbi:uncharacterized [Tachysurus ichikawai]
MKWLKNRPDVVTDIIKPSLSGSPPADLRVVEFHNTSCPGNIKDICTFLHVSPSIVLCQGSEEVKYPHLKSLLVLDLDEECSSNVC